MPIRSFIALELSGEVKARISELLTKLRHLNVAVKWVNEDSLHLTLKFLGDVPEERIDDIVSSLQSVLKSVESFEFTVRGVGGFPDMRRPRVIWVGVDATPPLMQLQRLIEGAMEKLGFPPEGRSFHPHVTLGRVKSNLRIDKVLAVLTENKAVVFGTVVATSLTVFRSDLSREGPHYTPLARLSFGP